jgi:thiamine-phosphate pyrophosphorylase
VATAASPLFELLLITDPGVPLGLVESVRAALVGLPAVDAPRVAVQLRAKNLGRDELAKVAESLRDITRTAGVRLTINGDLELARVSKADGVHLPESGPPLSAARAQLGAAALIGASCHDPTGLARAALGGASYATLSPVFESPGKGPPLGLARFGEWVRAARLPVIALGGLTAAHAASLRAAGASGVAVIRAVLAAPDPAAALRELLDVWSTG